MPAPKLTSAECAALRGIARGADYHHPEMLARLSALGLIADPIALTAKGQAALTNCAEAPADSQQRRKFIGSPR